MELLTHSKRRDFLNCPRYYYLRHERGLALRIEKPGRRRGSIFGDALQVARDRLWDSQEEPSREVALGAAMESIDAAYDEIHPKDQEQADELELERVKLRVMVVQYVYRYGMAARREVEFELPFPHPATGGQSKTFRLAGKIDGIEVVRPKVGRVIEDKLVGQIQQAMIDRLPLDAQATEYVNALLTRGWQAEVAYRHTRFPGINPEKAREYKTKPNRPAESLGEFESRLMADVSERPDFYFDEQILVFPQVHMDEYEAERWNVGQMVIEARQRFRDGEGIAAFPKNPSRCWEYGGCEFIPLCTMRPDAGDLYVIREDSPELGLVGRSADGGVTDEYGPQA